MQTVSSRECGFTHSASESAYPNLWSGLWGWWNVGTQSRGGDRVFDLSPLGNNGVLQNMNASQDYVLQTNYPSLDFDGTNDFVQISRSVPVGRRTISVWFYRSSTVGRRGLFGTRPTGDMTGQGFFLSTSVTSSGTLSYQHPGITAVTSAGGIWTANRWNHVAVTVTPERAVAIYLNGQSVHTGTVASFESSNTNAWIGAEEGLSPEVFQGQIADVRLYTRVLSVPEICLLAMRPNIGLELTARKRKIAGPAALFSAAWASRGNAIIGGGVC
jgi:hypothetical protein